MTIHRFARLTLVMRSSFRDHIVKTFLTGILATLLVPTVASQTVPFSFFPAQGYTIGATSFWVATADFNSDGKTDLVVANPFISSVNVFMGNGDGTFRPPVPFSVGNTPVFVATADFNGDGKTDIVTTDQFGNTITVLLGNGDGTFQPPILTSTGGGSPFRLATADLNGDGKVDVVVGNLGGGVSVLLGNGDGTFQAPVVYAAGSSPSHVAIGDFNKDGKPDFVVTNRTNNTISVFLGNGDGTFRATATYTVGQFPDSVAVGDLNRDGNLDVAVGELNSNAVGILLGNGDGTFQPEVEYSSSAPSSVIIGDLNGDGKPDVISCGGNAVTIMLSNGDGTFQTPVQLSVGALARNVVMFVPSAFSGGAFDLATANNVGQPDLSIFIQLQPNLGDSSLASLSGGNNFSGNQFVSGTVSATDFFGNGSGLTNLQASKITGTLSDANLPPDVARLGIANSFTNAQSISFNSVNAALTVRNSTATGVLAAGNDYGLYGSGAWGVYGSSTSATGVGVQGVGSASGVSGQSYNGVGVYGVTLSGGIAGVFNATNGGKIMSGQNSGTEVFNVTNNGSVNASGSLTTSGPVTIGGGTAILKHLSATFSASFAALKPSACSALTFTLSGAADGDTLALGVPSALMAAAGVPNYTAWVSAANTITLRACNLDANISQKTGVSGTVRVDVWKH